MRKIQFNKRRMPADFHRKGINDFSSTTTIDNKPPPVLICSNELNAIERGARERELWCPKVAGEVWNYHLRYDGRLLANSFARPRAECALLRGSIHRVRSGKKFYWLLDCFSKLIQLVWHDKLLWKFQNLFSQNEDTVTYTPSFASKPINYVCISIKQYFMAGRKYYCHKNIDILCFS